MHELPDTVRRRLPAAAAGLAAVCCTVHLVVLATGHRGRTCRAISS